MCGLRLLRSYICFATSQISLLTKQTLFFRLFVFCSFAPSPHGYTVSRGVPKIPKKSGFLDSNSLKTARNFSLKSQNFDGFLGFFVGSENPSVRVAHCTFEITLSGTITLTLLLVCAFSPKVQKYLLGSPLTDFQVLGKTQKGANYVANLAFDQTNSFHSFVCLLLVCSFSPRVLSIPRGPQNP
jgi:hypothetical protein